MCSLIAAAQDAHKDDWLSTFRAAKSLLFQAYSFMRNGKVLCGSEEENTVRLHECIDRRESRLCLWLARRPYPLNNVDMAISVLAMPSSVQMCSVTMHGRQSLAELRFGILHFHPESLTSDMRAFSFVYADGTKVPRLMEGSITVASIVSLAGDGKTLAIYAIADGNFEVHRAQLSSFVWLTIFFFCRLTCQEFVQLSMRARSSTSL